MRQQNDVGMLVREFVLGDTNEIVSYLALQEEDVCTLMDLYFILDSSI